MTYYYLLFFFLTVGAKLLLAVVMIYYLLPADARCDQCDEDTLLLAPEGMRRVGSRLTLGWVRWRWCPRCGWEGATRPLRRASKAGAAARPHSPTRP